MKHLISSIRSGEKGFTLTELLVVIGIVSLLALMLLPALASSKGDGRVLRCMNNQKQLTQAWLLYTTDVSDRLPPNSGGAPPISSWASGVMDWTSSTDNTNSALLESYSSVISSYVKAAALFKCPADTYQSAANPGPRVRSISMNGALNANGTGPTVQGTYPGGRTFYGSGPLGTGTAAKKMVDLAKPGPAQVFVLLDEHPDSIDDSAFMLDPGYSPGGETWRSLPGSFHDGSGSLSFADGHFELHKWTGGLKTLYPVTYASYPNLPWANVLMTANSDYEWLVSKMPYR
jgi:prepilin-type N-terminal cleavage/methylation domain-containing protein